MVRVLIVLMVVAGPAMAQSAGGQSAVTGQQNNQPSANQNQSQLQTNDSQTPTGTKVLPPSSDAQAQPNPLPELSK